MSSTRRLQPVADIARQRERQAAKQHGDSLREFQKQQHQLDELIKYRNQYVEKFQNAGKQGLSIVQMRDYQSFITRLDTAIAQQKQHVINGEQASNATRENLVDKRSRTKMINKVVESRVDGEKIEKQRKEQREQDDRIHDPVTGS